MRLAMSSSTAPPRRTMRCWKRAEITCWKRSMTMGFGGGGPWPAYMRELCGTVLLKVAPL